MGTYEACFAPRERSCIKSPESNAAAGMIYYLGFAEALHVVVPIDSRLLKTRLKNTGYTQ